MQRIFRFEAAGMCQGLTSRDSLRCRRPAHRRIKLGTARCIRGSTVQPSIPPRGVPVAEHRIYAVGAGREVRRDTNRRRSSRKLGSSWSAVGPARMLFSLAT